MATEVEKKKYRKEGCLPTFTSIPEFKEIAGQKFEEMYQGRFKKIIIHKTCS